MPYLIQLPSTPLEFANHTAHCLHEAISELFTPLQAILATIIVIYTLEKIEAFERNIVHAGGK